VTGRTSSTDFPTVNAVQGPAGGFADLFVAKLTPDGTALVYATYLGGSGYEMGMGIAVDSAGAAYVAGLSDSADFPTVNAFQPASGGSREAVVVKLSADGSRLVYSTFFGGDSYDVGNAIAVDPAGAAYIAGGTGSEDFPLVNAVQGALGGCTDVFVAKLAPDGRTLLYSSFFGGIYCEEARDLAVDSLGHAYVTGWTETVGFPSVNPLPAPPVDGYHAFVSKLAPDGTHFIYSTALGGSADDFGNGIAIDASGAAYVTGYTHSDNFPTRNAVQPRLSGPDDAFVVKLAPEGGAMIFGTFLGGSQNDGAAAIAVAPRERCMSRATPTRRTFPR
jgi:hypothetical protein